MARYHLLSKTVDILAAGDATVDFGPESYTNVCENIALWLDGGSATWTVNFNGAASASTGNYAAGVAKKVYTEAGPLATMVTYPSVKLHNAGGNTITVTATWTALIRQDNG
jgi:hypothetical protein